MTETVFIRIREEVSRELYKCKYIDLPPEYNDIVEEEAYRRYEDWKQDNHDRLNEGMDERNAFANNILLERIGMTM